jgi:hypothetical protein
LSLKSLYLSGLSIKPLPQALSLKLVVEGLELMTKGFKLGVKLDVRDFPADLGEGYSYLLENFIK